MASYLITGGTGFIGSRLSLYLVQAAQQVRVLAQSNTPAETENLKELQDSGVQVFLGSVTDPAEIAPAIAGVDYVIHLAAAQHEANVGDEHFRNVNVEGTRNMLNAAVSAQVKRFVHGSTIGVYGTGVAGTLDEFSPVNPHNIYGRTKLAGEKLVLEYADKLSVVAIRISETYGPRDRRLLKLFKAIRKNKFFRIGRGTNLHHLIYVDDLVQGMVRAVESAEASGKVFVLSGKDVLTTDEMIDAVADAVGATRPRLRFPLWPFMLLAQAMESFLRPMGIQPPLHPRRMDFFRKSFRFQQDQMRNVLGYTPEWSFRDGCRETASWYIDHGLL